MLGPTISDPTVATGSRELALCGHHQLCGYQRLADPGQLTIVWLAEA
jgi:hypothetical protein